MKLRRKVGDVLDHADDTLTDVRVASGAVVETTTWATVALVAVAAVSLAALLIASSALSEVRR